MLLCLSLCEALTVHAHKQQLWLPLDEEDFLTGEGRTSSKEQGKEDIQLSLLRMISGQEGQAC